jgi:Tol biopolymer transport system component
VRRAPGRPSERLRSGGLLALCMSLAHAAIPALAQTTTRVSIGPAGQQGNGPSGLNGIALSADGNVAAFQTAALNFAPGHNGGVFVRDLAGGTTVAASVSDDGMHAAGSYAPSLSSDGRYVAFHSDGANLVPGDTNLASDVFVRDLASQRTTRVSVTSSGDQAMGFSSVPSISSDGRFVAFESAAGNLGRLPGSAMIHVYVHDRLTGTTTLVSRGSLGNQATLNCTAPVISGDGRFVAFVSADANLVGDDTNRASDVFVHDVGRGTTARVSVTTSGMQASGISVSPAMSPDGRFVAFSSTAGNLAPGDTNNVDDVFVYDRAELVLHRVSVASNGMQANGRSITPSISADGRFVAFRSEATNLVAGDTNGASDVFVHDRETGATTRQSVSGTCRQSAGAGTTPVISGSGGRLLFLSREADLVAGDTNLTWDVFLRDGLAQARPPVVPSIGSEAGGDVVHLPGACSATMIRVEFGAAVAAVLESTPERLTVQTPAGTGIVDVRVSSTGSSVSYPGAFTYLADELLARRGTVNLGRADREDVLFLNATVGDPLNRELSLAVRQPITTVMLTPSTRAEARFVLYAWAGVPRPETLTALPRGLGSMVFAPPFVPGAPATLAIWNNAGYRSTLGAPTHPSRPAPSVVFTSAAGAPNPARVTLQGLIEDDASRIPEGWSITNAVILRITP